MDGPLIDQKIRFGYAKAAQKLGQDFQLYRPTAPINPLDSPYLIGTIKAVMTVDWKWMKGNRPGNAIWFACIDGQNSTAPLSAQESDYLVGDKTFFVLSKEYQLPIQVVECNAVLSIARPYQATGGGRKPYAAPVVDTATPQYINMPASILQDRQGSRAVSNLPSDTLQPMWKIMLPNIGDVEIRTGDIATDGNGITYVISVQEKTAFGWRLIGQQQVN